MVRTRLIRALSVTSSRKIARSSCGKRIGRCSNRVENVSTAIVEEFVWKDKNQNLSILNF